MVVLVLLRCTSGSYYPEDYGSVSNDKSILKVSNRLAPARVEASNLSGAEQVPSEVTFRDEVTGALYVDVNGRPIAEGSFGAVHVVRSSSGEKMTLKVPKPTARIAMIRKEACFLSRVQGHDNVVKFYGVVEDVRGPCLLMQLYQLRDFHALLNVLVDTGMQLKITDLGLAEESSVVSKRTAGTPGYWAPEVQEGKVHSDKIDVFSLGVIFHQMVSKTRLSITVGNFVKRPPENFLEGVAPCEDAKNLLARTLAVDVRQRIKLPDLAKHRFLCLGVCPQSLPDTAFDVAPVFDTTTEKHARNSDSSGESSGAFTRKKMRAEESEAYRVFVAKEAVKERHWAALLAQVQARIRQERRDLQAERVELRDLFGSDFRDDGRGTQDGSDQEDEGL
ncbi:kinase-like domain-containing protein [Linnemannia elongata]|nr:kinase-like domain-containing protein [Linnemannia elongata]